MSERPDAPHASNPREEEGRDDMVQYLDKSSNIFSEDELGTWFQYRLDDSFERDYYSDILRHWPSPATTATTSYGSQGAGYGAAPEGGEASSGMVGASQPVGIAAKSSSKVEGAAELTRSNSADAALALGAGRAAGIISRQTGVESFSKVRTSLQPRAPKLDSPPLGVAKTGSSPLPALAPRNLLHKSPSFPAGTSILPPRSRTLASHGNMWPFQQGFKFGKPSNTSELSRPSTTFASENFVNKQCLGIPVVGGSSASDHTDHSLPESSTTALEAERLQSANASVYRSKEEDASGIPVRKEQTGARSSSDAIDSSADRAWSESLERSRMSGVSLPSFEKKTDGLDIHSGGSQTSESLKDSKLSAKRKLEDSECQSANAEGESAEIKSYQPRTSTSKRSRAAETHNLSERRRRDRINEKMKALQELIPNSNKTDKASVLDEAIEYLKMLQLQLQMMSVRSGVSLSPTVLPHGLPHMQIPQLGQLHPFGMGMTGGFAGTGSEVGPSVTLGIAGGTSGTGAEAGMVTNMDFRMGMPTGASGTGEGTAQHIGLGMGITGVVSGTSPGTGPNIGVGMVDMTFTAPARPLSCLPSPSAPMNYVFRPSSAPTVYTSPSHSQTSITTESLPVYFPHSQFQDPAQSIRFVNMDMYNTYLQQQQQLQQLQHQQLQQLTDSNHHKQQQQHSSRSQK